MKLKFGAIVTEGRGKIGGHVATVNKSGACLRTKSTPVNRQSSAQMSRRNSLTSISQAWRSLTQAQRNAWNAAAPSFVKSDIFGDLRLISGFNIFVKLNSLIELGGGSMILAPVAGEAPDSIGIVGGSVQISSDWGIEIEQAVPAGFAGLIFATAQYSGSNASIVNNFKYLQTIVLADDVEPRLSTAYNSVWGVPYAVGWYVRIKLVIVNLSTGLVSTPSYKIAEISS